MSCGAAMCDTVYYRLHAPSGPQVHRFVIWHGAVRKATEWTLSRQTRASSMSLASPGDVGFGSCFAWCLSPVALTASPSIRLRNTEPQPRSSSPPTCRGRVLRGKPVAVLVPHLLYR